MRACTNPTGANNTLLGSQAGVWSTTANNNTIVGLDAGFYNTTGSSNLFLGVDGGALNTTGDNDIYLAHVGVGAESNTTRIGGSQSNAFIAGIYGAGVSSGASRCMSIARVTWEPAADQAYPRSMAATGQSYRLRGTIASRFMGTLPPAPSGTYDQQLAFSNTGNVYSGTGLNVSGTVTGGLVNSTGGYQVNGTTTFTQNALNDIFIGQGAGNASMTGGDSQFIGHNSGMSITTGNSDVFLGTAAGASTTTGNGDVYVGWASGNAETTAAYNTFLGAQTGFYTTTGGSDLYLGFDAGFYNTTGSNNVYLANGGVDGESNTTRIGGGQQSTYIAGIYGVTMGSGVSVYINSNGQLGTLTSSQKYKEDIRDMGDTTSALMQSRSVTFRYKADYDKGERSLQHGLIAEEVAKVYPDLVAYNPDGTPYTVRYQYLSSMLLNELQKQYTRAQTQEQRIAELEQRIARIESLMAEHRADGRTAQSSTRETDAVAVAPSGAGK